MSVNGVPWRNIAVYLFIYFLIMYAYLLPLYFTVFHHLHGSCPIKRPVLLLLGNEFWQILSGKCEIFIKIDGCLCDLICIDFKLLFNYVLCMSFFFLSFSPQLHMGVFLFLFLFLIFFLT
jgi:hypothetical protein